MGRFGISLNHLLFSPIKALLLFRDPNGKNKPIIWHAVSTPRLEYLHIHDLKLTMKEQPFWDDYLFLKSVAQK